MRGLDGDRLPGLRLPVRGEGFFELAIQFARRIVGDIEQRRIGKGKAETAELDRGRQRGGEQYGSSIEQHGYLHS